MGMVKLYGFSRVTRLARGKTRDLRVLWALEELEMPFEIVGMDHPNHALEAPAFRAMNPFAQIPVLEDDGVVLAESGAILIYLAKKAGRLIPNDPAGEAQVVRWCLAALNTVEFPLLALQLLSFDKNSDSKAAKDQMTEIAKRHLGNLDRWLATREFLAVDSFTIADLLMTHVIGGEAEDDLLAPFERVHAYVDRCSARPAWHRALDAYCKRVEAA